MVNIYVLGIFSELIPALYTAALELLPEKTRKKYEYAYIDKINISWKLGNLDDFLEKFCL